MKQTKTEIRFFPIPAWKKGRKLSEKTAPERLGIYFRERTLPLPF